MFGLVSVDIEYFNPVIVTLSSSDQKKNISLNCPNQTNPCDSPISLPKSGNTGIDHCVIHAHFEVVKNNLNLEIFSSVSVYVF